MGAYALTMGSIAAVLAGSGQRQAQGLVLKFLEHFAGIREALVIQGLWDEADGLFYDRLLTPSGGLSPRMPGTDLNAVVGRDGGRAAGRVGREDHHAHRRDRLDVAEDARDALVK